MVAAYSLWEMACFGFDAAEVAARIEEEAKRWKDNDAEVGSDESELAAWDEIFKELEAEDRKAEEGNLEFKMFKEQMRRIMVENEKVYAMILFDEIQKIKTINDLFESYQGDCRSEEWDTGKPVGNEIW